MTTRARGRAISRLWKAGVASVLEESAAQVCRALGLTGQTFLALAQGDTAVSRSPREVLQDGLGRETHGRRGTGALGFLTPPTDGRTACCGASGGHASARTGTRRPKHRTHTDGTNGSHARKPHQTDETQDRQPALWARGPRRELRSRHGARLRRARAATL